MSTTISLLERHCVHRAPALDAAAIAALHAQVPDWSTAGDALERRFAFLDFHETMAFVNALAWIAHREDHHPDLHVGYNRCTVRFTTHSAGNLLSDNDFICAAMVDALLAKGSV